MAREWLRQDPDEFPEGHSPVRLLKVGGAGSAWLARDQNHDEVTIKIALPETARDTVERKRFEREGPLLAGIDHPHVVRCKDWGRLPSGRPYNVQEYIAGEDLHRRACHAHGALAWDRVTTWIADAAEGIAACHAQNVIHRDMKPSNLILRSRDDHVVVIDFSLAKSLDATADEADSVTLIGHRGGSSGFCAVEQFGRSLMHARKSTDIFGLAAVLFWLLLQKTPFGEDQGEQISRMANDRIKYDLAAMRPDVPLELVALLRWCLRCDPSCRPQSAALVAEMLRRFGRSRFRVVELPNEPVTKVELQGRSAAGPSEPPPGGDTFVDSQPAVMMAVEPVLEELEPVLEELEPVLEELEPVLEEVEASAQSAAQGPAAEAPNLVGSSAAAANASIAAKNDTATMPTASEPTEPALGLEESDADETPLGVSLLSRIQQAETFGAVPDQTSVRILAGLVRQRRSPARRFVASAVALALSTLFAAAFFARPVRLDPTPALAVPEKDFEIPFRFLCAPMSATAPLETAGLVPGSSARPDPIQRRGVVTLASVEIDLGESKTSPDEGPRNGTNPSGIDEAAIRKGLEGKVWSGKATFDEIRMLKGICSHMGDRACRDRAAAMFKQKLEELKSK